MIYAYLAITSPIKIAEIKPEQKYIFSTINKSNLHINDTNPNYITPKVNNEVLYPEFTPHNHVNLKNFPNPHFPETLLIGEKVNHDQFTILPVGISINNKNSDNIVLIRGLEDGSQAIKFEQWLLPFDHVISSLGIITTSLNDGQLELRSPGLVTRIAPQELQIDPELGLVISVAEIKKYLQVPTEFDIIQYAIVFKPPWLDLPKQGNLQPERPVILEGLPQIKPPVFSFSTFGQNLNISGNNNNTTTQGELTTIGTVFGGSWYVRTNQSQLTDIKAWNISEAQYLRQTPLADYVVGSQPTFWRSQTQGQYWGFSTVQRFGYTAPIIVSESGFSPNQRRQSNRIRRTISGEATPGSLVQLVPGFGNDVVAEELVDSSGVYRFENIPTSNRINNTYWVRIYPNGQLTATPEIREANFSNLPGQLSKGTSALIISSGLRQENSANSLIGNFTGWRGGVAYRLGLTEDLTVGAGIIYEDSLLSLGEIFYQPSGFPLQVAFSGLLSTEKGFVYNANIRFTPLRNLNFNFNSDEISQRFFANWQASRGVRFRVTGDTRQNTLAAGINLSQTQRHFSTFASADIDTNNNLRWNFNSRLRNWQFNIRGNEIATNSLFTYNFSENTSRGSALNLGYETRNNNFQDNLTTLSWRYRSPARLRDGRHLWDIDLGYGFGSHGSGFITSASTNVIPGLNLRLRYQGISAISDSGSFRIELSPSFTLQPRLTPSDSRYQSFRNKGGILIQPFLDKNGNGSLDKNELIYTEDAELLLSLNYKPIKSLEPIITENGILIQLSPDYYRLDLDPAGYPIDWKPTESAYAVEVVAGGYTPIQIPFIQAYTVAGTVTDAEGKLVGGARVEAVLKGKGMKVISVTSGAGIFYLENLQRGNYHLLINGQLAQPENLTIDVNSEPLQEVNLKLLIDQK